MLIFVKKIIIKVRAVILKLLTKEEFYCNFTEDHKTAWGNIEYFKEYMFLDDGIVLKEGPAVKPSSITDIGLYKIVSRMQKQKEVRL